MISRCPKRTTPIVGGDLNDGVGQELEQGYWQMASDCGQWGARERFGIGTRVREALADLHLTCAGTHFPAGAIFYSWSSCSQLGWIFVPSGLMHRIRTHTVLHRLGRRLQTNPCKDRRDHYPVFMAIETAFSVGNECNNKAVAWDKDLLMEVVMGYCSREPFLATVEENWQQLKMNLAGIWCVKNIQIGHGRA